MANSSMPAVKPNRITGLQLLHSDPNDHLQEGSRVNVVAAMSKCGLRRATCQYYQGLTPALMGDPLNIAEDCMHLCPKAAL